MLLGSSSLIDEMAKALGFSYGFDFRAVLSVLLVTAICGMVGALVVGNRMAFFSDAMAHCAFAGVALGILLTLLLGAGKDPEAFRWLVPLIMVIFGAVVGLAIAFVKEKTELASDTVIGVFFAGAIGFGAMLLSALKHRRAIDPETFLFGSPLYVQDIDFLYLSILLVLVCLLLSWRYNHLLLASFNQSLARSRKVSLRLNNYLFILLLALIVNLSIVTVGALLINAMLIVPAATASNVVRNLRQMFWATLSLSVTAGMLGLYLSNNFILRFQSGIAVEFGPSGTIICVSVFLFFLSMVVATVKRRTTRSQSRIA
ncbi:MAG: metal ABC transporter permease [Planctomycetes bacterium]|nr:metal ABC transporter permease [Planctomycetota bacterium]